MEMIPPSTAGKPGRLRLPCGRTVTLLWGLLDAQDHQARLSRSQRALADHAAGCDHCTGELERLRALRELTSLLAERTPQPPDNLWSRVVAVIRTELRSGPDLVLIPGDARAVVSTAAVVRAVRAVLRRLPEVESVGKVGVTEQGDRGIVVTARITPAAAAPEGVVAGIADALRAGIAQTVGIPVAGVELATDGG